MSSDLFSDASPLPDSSRPRLIGESLAMRALRRSIIKIAAVNAPVLITGETGTGKELVALLLHEQSRRKVGPFVAVNCAALPAGLFQAEVFGYEKGAFTGAYKRNPGRIEAAQGGTLMLDEIGDVALDMQVVLLRFLEQGVFERLGGVKPIQADVRIVAATSMDLEEACRKGRFREDLYYRLNSLRVRTPPLRDRGRDIDLLAEHFLRELIAELGLRRRFEFAPDAIAAMRRYRWPGNVRELRNRVRQALVMSESERLHTADLELSECGDDATSGGQSLKACREAAERQAIEHVLLETRGDVPRAAERLRISRAQLYRLIARHELTPSAPGRRRTDKAGLSRRKSNGKPAPGDAA